MKPIKGLSRAGLGKPIRTVERRSLRFELATDSTRSVEHPDQRRGFILAGLVRCIWLFYGALPTVRISRCLRRKPGSRRSSRVTVR
jgi:hypothetical protein